WFDWSRAWARLARILRKDGAAATWATTSEFPLPAHPHFIPLVLHYSELHATVLSIGPYWQQPGRNIVLKHLPECT
ncbi:hypothetical protein EDC04DRAFT_2566163, partial [Pisolithus marmoratus]